MNITTCNICGEEFIIKVKEKEVKHGIFKVYFNCLHCEAEYISHYTSALIKRKQHEIRNIQKKYQKERVNNPHRASKTFNRFQKLKKEIGKDMDKLEKRIKEVNK